MATVEINTPDGKVLTLNAPDGATPDQIHSAVQAAVEHYKTQQPAPAQQQPPQPAPQVQPPTPAQPQSMWDKVKGAASDALPGLTNSVAPGPVALGTQLPSMNPTARRALLQGAGTEIGQMAGPVAAGIGSAAGGAAADIYDNPKDTLTTAAKGAKVAGDLLLSPQKMVVDAAKVMTPQELKAVAERRGGDFVIGLTSGLLKNALTPSEATGPITAGMKSPELALPGGPDKAFEALGPAKAVARAGEDIEDASRLRKMMGTPGGRLRLAEEGIKKGKEGLQNSSPTQLLAYRDAAGQVAAKGGTFADDYMKLKGAATAALEDQAPGLVDKIQKAHEAFLSIGKGGGPMSLIDAVSNPISSAVKALSMPRVQTAFGAALRVMGEGAAPVSGLVSAGLDRMMKNKKRTK